MSINEPSTIDAEAFIVRRTITIAASQERVWAAVTEAEHLARWFPQHASLDRVAVGERGRFAFDGHGEFPVEIVDLDAPHRIAYRWGNDNAVPVDPHVIDPARSTVFEFTLEPIEDGTRLTVVESGFDTLSDPSESMRSNRGGWDWELDELVAYLEGGS